ncbi:MAG: hypothetical protein EBR34_03715 [Sphingomonadaceae bacterium]|nr:hypothetical protein [Sphingomonadaceae bacterium]
MVRLDVVRARLLRPPGVSNSIAVVSVTIGIATAVRWMLGSAADLVPFVTYYPAIVICTLLAGWRAGVASMFVAITAVNVVFLDHSFGATENWKSAAMLALFMVSCGLLVAIAQALRTTVARLQTATDRAEYLNQELLHRVRNSLTVVNSLAALTFDAEPTNFSAVFSKRMSALAGGLELLSRQGGELCDLRETVDQACRPFIHEDRIRIAGPSAMLPADSCIPLVLAIHELCTNAVKYGAFSVPDGSVTIELITDSGHGAGLRWQEDGGPPVVPPAHEGLGSALLAHPVLGPSNVIFAPQGLRCEMRLRTAG